jgi:hypothetical protein
MFQAWLSSFAQSYYALFRIQQRLGLVSELGHESEVDWEAFVQRFGVSVASNDAWQILGSIFGLTPGQRAQAGLTFEGGTSGTIEELKDFMGLALRVRYGYAADYWASIIPEIWLAWFGEPGPFLEYLKTKLHLDDSF